MTSSRKPRVTRRGAGRPSDDGVDHRERLLDAAIARFARDGIGATSLRAIAADAEVTPAMLHYYFGDKEQLKRALIDERLRPVLTPLHERLAQVDEDDPAALISAFVHGIHAAVARYPWVPSLWVREVLCEGGQLREVMFSELLPSLPHLLAGRFAEAQNAGRLHPAIDPRLLVVSLIGLTLFPIAGAPVWQNVFDAGDIDLPALLKHTMALLQTDLTAAPRGEIA